MQDTKEVARWGYCNFNPMVKRVNRGGDLPYYISCFLLYQRHYSTWPRKCNSSPPHPGDCNCALEQFRHVPVDTTLYLGISTLCITCKDHTHFPFDECDFCEQKQEPLMYLFKVRELGGDIPELYDSDTANLPRDYVSVMCSSCFYGFNYEPVVPKFSSLENDRLIPYSLACPFGRIYNFDILPRTMLENSAVLEADMPRVDFSSPFPFHFGFVIKCTGTGAVKSARNRP